MEFKIDVVFLDQSNELKRVIASGNKGVITCFVWKTINNPPQEGEIEVEKYMSMRKFFRESFYDVIPAYKSSIITSLVSHIKPKNVYSMWCHEESTM